ncbi:MAG: hypothetical protein DRP62_02845, partial [Planctomycetota bacterium]
MYKKQLFSISFVLLTIFAVTVQANLLCNPGFEENGGYGGASADYWTDIGAAGCESWGDFSERGTGTWGMVIYTWGEGAGNATVYQDIPVRAGIDYVYSMWTKRDGGTLAGSYTMKVEWYAGATLLGETSRDVSDEISDVWTEVTLNVTSMDTADTARVMLIGTGVDKCGKFDDANFAPIIIAHSPSPADGADYVDPNADLIWSAGLYAASHNVYFGTDFNDVNEAEPIFLAGDVNTDGQVDLSDMSVLAGQWLTNPGASQPSADLNSDGIVNLLDFAVIVDDWMKNSAFKGEQTETNFEPGVMGINTTYYWRIDEVNGVDTWKGNVWSFTVSYDYEIRITASSSENESLIPENAIDMDMETRWSSEFSDSQWLEIDLRKTYEISA